MFFMPLSQYFDVLSGMNKFWFNHWQNSTGDSSSSALEILQTQNASDLQAAMNWLMNEPELISGRIESWYIRQCELVSLQEFPDEDQQFTAPEWNAGDGFTFLKNLYLYLLQTTENNLGLLKCNDETINMRLKFFSRQVLHALSPANFAFTNPVVMARVAESKGQSLTDGVNNLLTDIQHSGEVLNVRQVSDTAFIPGENLATTSGQVIFRNDICELIQYGASTDVVEKTPLLVVPPLINKYYILDLTEKKSLVKWLVDQGHSVFMLSWKNPGSDQHATHFEDYVIEGIVRAVSIIQNVTGSQQINAVGYCLGGTLLAATVAYYAAKRMKKHIKTASYFTTILDFSEPGELKAFLHPQLVAAVDAENQKRGFMDGRLLNVTFNLLRENSLYWNYYIDRYLMGKHPDDFDLLYWSSDSTHMAASCWYDVVQRFYVENQLIQPRKYKLGGVYIDITKASIPSYFIATQDDHIALWKGVYKDFVA